VHIHAEKSVSPTLFSISSRSEEKDVQRSLPSRSGSLNFGSRRHSRTLCFAFFYGKSIYDGESEAAIFVTHGHSMTQPSALLSELTRFSDMILHTKILFFLFLFPPKEAWCMVNAFMDDMETIYKRMLAMKNKNKNTILLKEERRC
jgi:hypothetical protein